jgi:acetyltransferase-like isoleucine patch superfamily enzyme
MKKILFSLLNKTKYGKAILYSRLTQTPISFRLFILQKLLGFNKKCYWPVHFTSVVQDPNNILIGLDTAPGIMSNCYIQGYGGIKIGNSTQIGPGVGIISLNHNPINVYDYINQKFPSVIIGSNCWCGMNSIILPGVELGDFTIVGAGSVVTKSFSEGYCIIAGNPARIIKKLNKNECIKENFDFSYHGYIHKDDFSDYRNKYLTI